MREMKMYESLVDVAVRAARIFLMSYRRRVC